jgi:hypothetical protein
VGSAFGLLSNSFSSSMGSVGATFSNSGIAPHMGAFLLAISDDVVASNSKGRKVNLE